MKNKSFTLVEILVYVGILSVIVSVMVYFVSWGIRINAKIRINQEVLESARAAMDKIVFETRNARCVYAPTSVFNSHPGQLSLRTLLNSSAGESEKYVDFYLEDGILYFKEDGSAPRALTSKTIIVTNLVFKHLNPDISSSGIQIIFDAEHRNSALDPRMQSDISLVSSANLRVY